MSKAAKPITLKPDPPALKRLRDSPSDYAIDMSDWSHQNQLTWELQQKFLTTFAGYGTILRGAEAAEVSRQAVYKWKDHDVLSFVKRFDEARQAWRETLEDKAWERIAAPEGNRGSDILLIFMLKAAWPERYRDISTEIDDSARDVVKRLREWQTKLARQNQTPIQAVESSG